jgi:hypothetical protein
MIDLTGGTGFGLSGSLVDLAAIDIEKSKIRQNPMLERIVKYIAGAPQNRRPKQTNSCQATATRSWH